MIGDCEFQQACVRRAGAHQHWCTAVLQGVLDEVVEQATRGELRQTHMRISLTFHAHVEPRLR